MSNSITTHNKSYRKKNISVVICNSRFLKHQISVAVSVLKILYQSGSSHKYIVLTFGTWDEYSNGLSLLLQTENIGPWAAESINNGFLRAGLQPLWKPLYDMCEDFYWLHSFFHSTA